MPTASSPGAPLCVASLFAARLPAARLLLYLCARALTITRLTTQQVCFLYALLAAHEPPVSETADLERAHACPLHARPARVFSTNTADIVLVVRY